MLTDEFCHVMPAISGEVITKSVDLQTSGAVRELVQTIDQLKVWQADIDVHLPLAVALSSPTSKRARNLKDSRGPSHITCRTLLLADQETTNVQNAACILIGTINTNLHKGTDASIGLACKFRVGTYVLIDQMTDIFLFPSSHHT
jgi:hypothetical protein